MKTLIDGYHRFRQGSWPDRQKLFESLSQEGQRPKALVIACVDSRVDPTMIFDAVPGELLVIRNVANLIPNYNPDRALHGTSAAVEFGVRVLQIPHVIVLGHGQCGGVRALIDGAPDIAQDFVVPWMSIASSALDRAKRKCGHSHPSDQLQLCCEQEVIKTSLDNLRTFPWIQDKIDQGVLQLHGAWFAIHSGTLSLLQADGQFKDV